MTKKAKIIYIVSGLFISAILLSKKKIIQTVNNITRQKFIDSIKPYAVSIGNAIGVPYKFIIAQICLETGYGKSSLSSKYNNFGGIKEFGNGPKVSLLTTECKNGVCAKVYQPFAVYPTIDAGMKAQSKIYQNVNFKQYLNKTTNPYTYASLIQSGTRKYATDPNYVSKISKIIDTIA